MLSKLKSFLKKRRTEPDYDKRKKSPFDTNQDMKKALEEALDVMASGELVDGQRMTYTDVYLFMVEEFEYNGKPNTMKSYITSRYPETVGRIREQREKLQRRA